MLAFSKLPHSPWDPDWIVAQRSAETDDILSKLGVDYDPNVEEDDFEEDA